jgi:hypothetical protein
MICSIMVVGSSNPVAKVLYYSYYDGPIDGFACCRCCGKWYAFAATDQVGWDVMLFIFWEFEGADLNSVWMSVVPEGETKHGIELSEWDVLLAQVAIGPPLAGVVSRTDWPEILAVVSAERSGAGSWPWPRSIYDHEGSGLLKTIDYVSAR